MPAVHRITPVLWFDRQGEEAAAFYVSIFPNSRITEVVRYAESDHPAFQDRAGSAMVVAFELDGQPFAALNGGPQFQFSEAVSFQVACADQEEVDHYWERLSEGDDPAAQQCGWLKDRFGVSWQVTPRRLLEFMTSGDAAAIQRVTDAFMPMKKLDLAAIETAYAG